MAKKPRSLDPEIEAVARQLKAKYSREQRAAIIEAVKSDRGRPLASSPTTTVPLTALTWRMSTLAEIGESLLGEPYLIGRHALGLTG